MLIFEDIVVLLIVYKILYFGEMNINICDFYFIIKKFLLIFVGIEKFGFSVEFRFLRSVRLLVLWYDGEGQISVEFLLFFGIVKYFMCYKLIVDGVEREYYFVYVWWFKKYLY